MRRDPVEASSSSYSASLTYMFCIEMQCNGESDRLSNLTCACFLVCIVEFKPQIRWSRRVAISGIAVGH